MVYEVQVVNLEASKATDKPFGREDKVSVHIEPTELFAVTIETYLYGVDWGDSLRSVRTKYITKVTLPYQIQSIDCPHKYCPIGDLQSPQHWHEAILTRVQTQLLDRDAELLAKVKRCLSIGRSMQ